MPVSPQDFELYSRMTGAPMPSDAMSRMQMAPDVYNFTKNFAKRPNLLEKTGNLVKNIGRGAVMALGAPMVAESVAEQARMQEQLRNEAAKVDSESVTMNESPEQVSEKLQIEQEKTRRKQIEVTGRLDLENMRMTGQPSTTAGNYGQKVVTNSTSQNVINKKLEQGSQMADNTPNIAEVLSEAEESEPAALYGTNPLNVRLLKSEDVGTSAGLKQLAKFRNKTKLDAALKGAFALGQQEKDELVDDSTVFLESGSPLNDHVDIDPGENAGNVPSNKFNQVSGTNTGSTTNLEDHHREMRRLDAQERTKNTTPSNLLEQRAMDNEAAISSGFMSLDDEGRKKESIRLGSTGGIPNKTDMEEIRKDPEYKAAQESMKPKSILEKANGFLLDFAPQSVIRYGQMGSKASGIELNPSPNGDPTIGFAISNPKTKTTTKYTYPAPKDIFQEISQDPDDPATSEESLGRRKFNFLLNMAGRGERGIGERVNKEEFPTYYEM